MPTKVNQLLWYSAKRRIDVKHIDNQKPDLITVDGTMQLCQGLEIEPTQLEFLLISHQLGSERMGEFTRDAFTKGCLELQADTVQKLKQALNTTLKQQFETDEGFRKIYSYAFLLGRQTGQKSLCKDDTINGLGELKADTLYSIRSCYWTVETAADK